ncbi:hypothetical protein [Catalinimonas niigatensis]|uniref:hypothetical protein n=1 Tax=Catalinimonas niigatensis TaxID=1397264 RepID=UPI002665A626|nr:hypothetical protein [Catalinimonas niigatensis]WPP49956.1 hypothetical protein PZB72_25160 [Catalinimonas niigatensis]
MIRWIKIIISILIIISVKSCSEGCNCQDYEKNEVLLQRVSKGKMIVELIQVENGAFGTTAIIRTCDSKSNQIEEVSLRYEDRSIRIDKIEDGKIYLHHKYPEVDEVKFEDIALGEALINKDELKFKYILENKN